jgi:hypothetical protein
LESDILAEIHNNAHMQKEFKMKKTLTSILTLATTLFLTAHVNAGSCIGNAVTQQLHDAVVQDNYAATKAALQAGADANGLYDTQVYDSCDGSVSYGTSKPIIAAAGVFFTKAKTNAMRALLEGGLNIEDCFDVEVASLGKTVPYCVRDILNDTLRRRDTEDQAFCTWIKGLLEKK